MLFKEYRERNRLLCKLGYHSYEEYLESSEWAKIRRRVFEAHGGKCAVCRKNATQVHHMNYSKAALLGRGLTHFLPLCRPCHEAAEVDAVGRKRRLQQVNSILGRLALARLDKKREPKPGKAQRKFKPKARKAITLAKRVVSKKDRKFLHEIEQVKRLNATRRQPPARLLRPNPPPTANLRGTTLREWLSGRNSPQDRALSQKWDGRPVPADSQGESTATTLN